MITVTSKYGPSKGAVWLQDPEGRKIQEMKERESWSSKTRGSEKFQANRECKEEMLKGQGSVNQQMTSLILELESIERSISTCHIILQE